MNIYTVDVHVSNKHYPFFIESDVVCSGGFLKISVDHAEG